MVRKLMVRIYGLSIDPFPVVTFQTVEIRPIISLRVSISLEKIESKLIFSIFQAKPY